MSIAIILCFVCLSRRKDQRVLDGRELLRVAWYEVIVRENDPGRAWSTPYGIRFVYFVHTC